MITKITSTWVKSVVGGDTLVDTFENAWAAVINALTGTWGYISFDLIAGIPDKAARVTAHVIQSSYSATLDTELSGEQTINLPAISNGASLVTIKYINNSFVQSIQEYLIDEPNKSIDLNLTSGRKLITVSGTARRL